MKIIIMSKVTYVKEAQHIHVPFIAIRLGGDSQLPIEDTVAFPLPNNNDNVHQYLRGELCLLVDDVTLPIYGNVYYQSRQQIENEESEKAERLFNKDHANQIKNFVVQHLHEIEVIVVHCAAGQSRSAGVAAALHRVLNGDDSVIFNDKRYTPNMWIYQTLLKEYNLIPTEETSAFNNLI